MQLIDEFEKSLPDNKQTAILLDGAEIIPEKIGYLLPDYFTFSGFDCDGANVFLAHKSYPSSLFLKAVPRKENGNRRQIGYLPEPPQD